jgi:hypothetical protein
VKLKEPVKINHEMALHVLYKVTHSVSFNIVIKKETVRRLKCYWKLLIM